METFVTLKLLLRSIERKGKLWSALVRPRGSEGPVRPSRTAAAAKSAPSSLENFASHASVLLDEVQLRHTMGQSDSVVAVVTDVSLLAVFVVVFFSQSFQSESATLWLE